MQHLSKRHKRILISSIILSCILILTGCTTYNNFKSTFIDQSSSDDNTIYIGIYEPQTGANSANGLAEIKGIELANSIYNNVIGYDVVLVKVDTQSSTSSAESAIQNLISMNVVAIIGSCEEAASLIATEYIEEAGIPIITPSAVNPLITQDNGYYFRASITDSQMGAGIAEYLYTGLGSRNIAVVDITNDSTVTAVLDGFDTQINKLSKSSDDPVVLRTSVSVTDSSWDELIEALKESGADSVFLPITTDQMDTFLTAAEEAGLTDITIVGTRTWGTSEFAAMAAKHPDYKLAFPYDSVINDDNSTSNTITEETQRFIIEYANKYGENDLPTQNAALGYDAYLLIINAINNAKSTDGDAIREALLELNEVQGATGVFTFDSSGNTIRTVNIATVTDGKIVSEYVTSGTTKAGSIDVLENE